jgi:hypothetical protein
MEKYFFKPGATLADKLEAAKHCRWALEVTDAGNRVLRHPDGRQFRGEHVASLRAAHGKQMKIVSPAGDERELDLSPFHDDQRIMIRWVNLDTPDRLGLCRRSRTE